MTANKPPSPPSEDEIKNLVEQLAEAISGQADQNADKTIRLVEAITEVFGSMEAFYEQVYQYLSKEQKAILGKLLDEAVEHKKKRNLNLAAVMNSKAFERIIESFRHAGAGMMTDADHSAPISPAQYGVPATNKPDKDRGR